MFGSLTVYDGLVQILSRMFRVPVNGKSCTTALILRAILLDNPAAHIVLIDPHNEYASAFGEWGEVISHRRDGRVLPDAADPHRVALVATEGELELVRLGHAHAVAERWSGGQVPVTLPKRLPFRRP